MTTDSELIAWRTWTLRVRPGSGKKILLLLHGLSGNEDSMWIFTRNIAPEYWIISPRAIHPLVKGGYSWRPMQNEESWPNVEMFRSSAHAIKQMVDDYAAENNLDKDNYNLAGFSQGGAMAFVFAVMFPRTVQKLAVLSGFAPGGSKEIIANSMFLEKKFFVYHGSEDKVVPISMASELVNLLRDAGAQVLFQQRETGHKLDIAGTDAFHQYLSD